MATKAKKIDIGKTKKGTRRSLLPTFLFIVIACGAGYYVWTEPVGLELRQAIYTVIGPIEQVIQDVLTVD
jgi:hypothetical protein